MYAMLSPATPDNIKKFEEKFSDWIIADEQIARAQCGDEIMDRIKAINDEHLSGNRSNDAASRNNQEDRS